MNRPLAVIALLSLPACQAGLGPQSGDPLDGVERLDGVDVQDDQVAAIATTTEPQGAGLLGGLLRGMVGGGTAPEGIAAARDLPPATQQYLGEIGRTCGLSRSDMGTPVAQASGYTLYDTIPNSTQPRPHYVTGFEDGCARQFSAALATFGDIGTHEMVRYVGTEVKMEYSAADQAYEAVKSGFCRVSFGEPCGGQLDALSRRTTFLTAYDRFGDAGEWAKFLLSDGVVAGAAVESP